MKTIFEKSKAGKTTQYLPEITKAKNPGRYLPAHLLNQAGADLPEVSELDVVRHYTNLSQKNFSVDTHFYPLGSCTMKYNPKINEALCQLPEFTQAHPYLDQGQVQGCLQIMEELDRYLAEISGMDGFTLLPAAGAHGELTALLMMAAYFKAKGEKREVILVPDSSHGTNPASASMAGFTIKQIKSDSEGNVDLAELEKHLNDNVAGLMLTNPNTLGLFEKQIVKLAGMLHAKGALLYYDGANLNALMGKARPGDMGFDLIHINLHKTFATPHGGGGAGSGPVGAKGELVKYLPYPRVAKAGETYHFFNPEKTIGKIKAFYGNFLVLVRAHVYIRALGGEGLKEASEIAVLSANYLKEKLKAYYDLPYPRTCMHEFVLSAGNLKKLGVKALDVAKSLLDHGIHPPTIYFPLIVQEALMIEPTETENLETLDEFAQIMIEIAQKAQTNPEEITHAPQNTWVKRIDEVRAARELCLKG